MSILLSANMTDNLAILLDVLHVFLFALTVYLLNMLIKIVFLRERARTLWADMRFRNERFWTFLTLWFIYVLFLLALLFLLFL
jgi:hypothetical protein